jgi:hypothetical protein
MSSVCAPAVALRPSARSHPPALRLAHTTIRLAGATPHVPQSAMVATRSHSSLTERCYSSYYRSTGGHFTSSRRRLSEKLNKIETHTKRVGGKMKMDWGSEKSKHLSKKKKKVTRKVRVKTEKQDVNDALNRLIGLRGF